MADANELTVPALQPERDFLRGTRSLPDRASTLYITHTVQEHADHAESHEFSGMRLVFDREHDDNNLFRICHRDPGVGHAETSDAGSGEKNAQNTLRRLVLCADEIVIYGELCLPQTQVYLFARKLVFKTQGDQPGRINTSPRPHQPERANTGDVGKDGLKAGNLYVYVSEFEADQPQATHFCLRGGHGQGAFAGKDGADAATLPHLTRGGSSRSQYGEFHFDPPAIFYRLQSDYAASVGGDVTETRDGTTWGTQIDEHHDSANGKSATMPGKPGDAGDGGDFVGVLPARVIGALDFHDEKAQALDIAVLAATNAMQALHTDTERFRGYLEKVLAGVNDMRGSPESMDRKQIALSATQREAMVAQRDLLGSLRFADEALQAAGLAAGAALSPLAGDASSSLTEAFAGLRNSVATAVQAVAAIVISDDPVWCDTTVERNREISTWTGKLNQLPVALIAAIESGVTATVSKVPGRERIVHTAGGLAGKHARDVSGGSRGKPPVLAWYDVACSIRQFGGARNSVRLSYRYERKEGQSFAAPRSAKPVGTPGTCTLHSIETFGHAWLHPALLQTLLLYLRDAYLTAPEKMDTLIPLVRVYVSALEGLRPADMQAIVAAAGARYDDACYMQALIEARTLIHRFENNLDFFGNPAGWTPLFSLPVYMRLYESEIEQGLKTLVLAQLLRERTRKKEEAALIAQESLDTLKAATESDIAHIDEQRQHLKSLEATAGVLKTRVDEFTELLKKERERLLDKVKGDMAREKVIGFGIKALSALCQVIPYGQPALGAAAAAGQSLYEHWAEADDPLAAAGPISGLLGEVVKAKLEEKAAALTRDLKDDQEKGNKENRARAQRLTYMASNIGP